MPLSERLKSDDTNKNTLQDYTAVHKDMLQGNVLFTENHGLLMNVQKNIHIIEIYKYPDIRFQAIKVHMLKSGMSFAIIGIFKASGMTVK